MDYFTSDAADLRPGRVVARRYEIVRRIGAGGMGVVYEARDRQLGGNRVALKSLSPHACRAPESVERLRREVRLAQRVSHKNVCRVHDLVDAAGVYYLSMEFIEGYTLADWLAGQPGRRLPPETALPILLQVLDGVAAIHAEGIVHRDLKPANVMIANDGRARVLDFGVALDAHLTRVSSPGLLPGTLAYMAPEQWRGETLDARTDIYALGVILYETLTGQRPFDGDIAALSHQHQHVTPQDPSHLVPELGDNLAAVILYCLKKRPEERWESALVLRASLEAAVNDQRPTVTHDPSPAPSVQPAPVSHWTVGGSVGNAGAISGNGNIVGNSAGVDARNVAGSGNNFGTHYAGANTHAGGSVVTTTIHGAGGGSAGVGVVAGGAIAIVAVVVLASLTGIAYLLWQRQEPAATTKQSLSVTTPSTNRSKTPARAASPTPAPAPTLTPDRSVYVTCNGAREICATLESTLVEDLAQKGIRAVTRESAHARVTLRATLVDTREEVVHGAALAVSQYAVQAEATLARSGTRVLLPSGTLQADTLVGADGLEDRVRAQALSISDAVDTAVGR